MIKNFLNWIKAINIKDIYSFRNQVPIKEVNYAGIDDISKKEDYRIAISQNGKFIVTFDTANLRIKILENKDHRPFTSSKKEVNSNDNNKYCGLDNLDELDDIGQTITYFKINNDFMIEKFYKEEYKPSLCKVDSSDSDIINASDFEWSIDISNMQEINDGESFILIAISHINVNMDMRRTENKKIDNKKHDYKKENLNKIRFKCSSLSEKYELKDEGNKPDEACDIAINMKPRPTNKISEIKKGIAIYRFDLKKNQNGKESYDFNTVTCHYSNQISGICRFIDDSSKDDSKSLNDSRIKRFIILNFRGIYNFEFDDHFDSFNLNEKFEYPTNIRRELDIWYTDNCMKRLLSCIYDKYFFVPQYKNDVLLLKVYDLAKMELETTIKKSKNKNYFTLNSNDNAFSFSRLQLCFTRGNNTIRLYYIKNGLEVALKSFKEIERIYLLEFIENDEKLLIIGKGPKKEGLIFAIWDLYNTGKVELIEIDDFPTIIIENFGTHLARASGNILHIGNNGKVSSVLKKIEKELKMKKENEKKVDKEKMDKVANSIIKLLGKKPDGKPDESHNIHYNEKHMNFKPIVSEKEPWMLGDYDRHSYCLYYHNQKGAEVETLQLIVGRSTVQIWHQIQDSSRNKDELPNNGEPFLEYIWTNRIPINQEREETKLRIKDFKYGSNVGLHEKLDDFHLKVYWYERKDNKENSKRKSMQKKKSMK
ncbi:hypothetical protein RhiirA5_458558 [Rhizophagus irregularis]|uniref:Uncharacterized protein n=1 Tax=Rhizophagus irregularis TaxID=588596 RepID=A0A2N0P1A7_9GLOM|nr:hypothetical protein RhiirA5_458558 [Rhizophagus irregularis]